MCYHFSLSTKVKKLEEYFQAKFDKKGIYDAIYHSSAFDCLEHPVILNEEPNKFQSAKWGLVPHWVKDIETANKLSLMTANARAESVFEKASFRRSIKTKRCLVPVDGFFEWRTYKSKKYPYYIQRPGHEPFALAGLWDEWTDPKSGEVLRTFSVITTEANEFIAKIHYPKNRMPVILEKKTQKKWLDESLGQEGIASFLHSYDGMLEASTVSKLITARGADTNVPSVQKEYKYEELPAL